MQRNLCHVSVITVCLCLLVGNPAAQARAAIDIDTLAWSTDSTGPRRFVSVHGRRAAIFGYPQNGLEIWAYPFQIVSAMRVSFRPAGTTTVVDGSTVLRRIVYRPESVTRIYAGPDFVVHEKLFVPLDEPGTIVSYEVQSAHPLEIVVRFTPVLDLMWPASIGGQEAVWNPAASAYDLFEPTHRFTASIGSPDIVAHDTTVNSNWVSSELAFTLLAGGEHKGARFVVAGGRSQANVSEIVNKLLEQATSLESQAVEHYSEVLRGALQIETPDAETNRALAWSEIALDQAWVCNPDLDCGLVAGYGPSRKARRPQYDWFFAGDGMVDIRGLLAAGEYDRARQELEFILKYQDPKTGMIWHELSQSTGWLDWAKYPYMFLHVDLTFDFLRTVGQYLATTGDQQFVNANWSRIESAHKYCLSLIDPKGGLPRIPSEKRGQREQEEFSDELTLSASWVNASRAFADLAAATGHEAEASEARVTADRALRVMNERYWDNGQKFWITGYTRSGEPLIDRNLGAVGDLETPLFSATQRAGLLTQIASSDFQADWGTRGRASSDSTYAPNSYANGSVWGISTAGAAAAFWSEHRPATALPIWRALVPWSSLDSPGHMHEALAGDSYREELESVPEQTWSSSSFFSTAVNGLLGLRVDAMSHGITLAPHLPPQWQIVSVKNIKMRGGTFHFRIVQTVDQLRLDLQNDGPPFTMVFDPQVPFGAKLIGGRLADRSISARIEEHDQDTHARAEFTAPHGNSVLTLSYRGGVSIVTDPPELEIGESSRAVKITAIDHRGATLDVNLDYLPSATSGFEIRTPWPIRNAKGASLAEISKGRYRVMLTAQGAERFDAYQHGKVTITFAASN